jgi:hypothetical protein
MVETREMMSASGLTLYPAMEAVPRRLRTRTIVDPFPEDATVPHDDLDLSDDRLDAIEDLSKALEKEKRTLIKRIALCYLEIEVEDLQATDASQRQQASMLPPLPTNPNTSNKSSLEDEDRRHRRQRGPSKRPWRCIIQEGQDDKARALVLQRG